MEHTTVTSIEEAIGRIPGVEAARVVLDAEGKPAEIHIVASSDKAPKQLVRDVQTVAMATLDLEIDHRVVSVVQFPAGAGSMQLPRVVVDEVSTSTKSGNTEVRVVLQRGSKRGVGESIGPTSAEATLRTAAVATAQALEELLEPGTSLRLDYVGTHETGSHRIADVLLSMTTRGATASLAGVALVSDQEIHAAVRAVLHALNRRL